MLNHITIMGRFTKEPEIRTTQSGTSVATFTVAVDRDFQSGGNKQTDFINCVAWKNTAEFIQKYFHKGSMAVVSGKLQSRQYENRDGQKVTVWEVQTDNIYFGESKKDAAPAAPATFTEVDDDGELPF